MDHLLPDLSPTSSRDGRRTHLRYQQGTSSDRRLARRSAALVVTVLLLLGPGIPAAVATSDSSADPDELARLQLGAEVYTSRCSSCHQPGGIGLAGRFPPLLDNPNIGDAAYVADVIENGRQGPIEVLGQSYDGVMPSLGTLADDEVAAVIAYLQNGLVVPGVAPGEQASGPVLATDLPSISLLSSGLAFLTFLAVAGLMISPLLISSQNRLQFPLVDAWLRSAAIVVASVIAVVLVPNLVLTSAPVSGLSRVLQDLIGLTVFGGGLILLLGALWWAHRESRI